MARWDNEGIKFKSPDCNKIQCKDCLLREKDRPALGINGAALAVCEAYTSKPAEVLFKGDKCPYYICESDSEDGEGNESD